MLPLTEMTSPVTQEAQSLARTAAASAEKTRRDASEGIADPLSDAQLRGPTVPAPLKEGPAGPQGGLQARGSFVAGQQLAAARTLSLPSTCFIGGHLLELPVPGAAGTFGNGAALGGQAG